MCLASSKGGDGEDEWAPQAEVFAVRDEWRLVYNASSGCTDLFAEMLDVRLSLPQLTQLLNLASGHDSPGNERQIDSETNQDFNDFGNVSLDLEEAERQEVVRALQSAWSELSRGISVDMSPIGGSDSNMFFSTAEFAPVLAKSDLKRSVALNIRKIYVSVGLSGPAADEGGHALVFDFTSVIYQSTVSNKDSSAALSVGSVACLEHSASDSSHRVFLSFNSANSDHQHIIIAPPDVQVAINTTVTGEARQITDLSVSLAALVVRVSPSLLNCAGMVLDALPSSAEYDSTLELRWALHCPLVDLLVYSEDALPLSLGASEPLAGPVFDDTPAITSGMHVVLNEFDISHLISDQSPASDSAIIRAGSFSACVFAKGSLSAVESPLVSSPGLVSVLIQSGRTSTGATKTVSLKGILLYIGLLLHLHTARL